MSNEVWRTHPSYSHLEVSSLGRVRNTQTGREIGAGTDGRAYRRVYLRRGRAVGVAVLVLETFVGPRPAGHDADHRNHDSLDNRLANLRWRPEGENRSDHHKVPPPPACPSGHDPSEMAVNSRGHRICRRCVRESTARWRASHRST